MAAFPKKTIAIIGAGLSGLQAARTILSHPNATSYDIIILEARDRIGGRVYTKSQWGLPLDFGASFIHGTDGNPLTAIAEKVGATFAYYSSQTYYDGNGNALETKTSSRLYQKVWEYFEAAIDCSRENFVDEDRSVQDFFNKRLEEDETLENEYMRDLLGSALQLLAGFVGSDLDQLSLKYFWTTDELPGARPFIDSSYDPIIRYVAHPALSQNSVRLNTLISSVEIDTSKGKPITLTSTANETFYADSVIVTIPLGSLRRDAIKFTPPLPLDVQKAISNLGFGVFEKLFIRFSVPWWLDPLKEGQSIGLDFFRFIRPISKRKELPEGTLNFFSLARIHNPQPVFGVFVALELAKYLISLSKDQLKSILQTCYIPSLPNYDAKNSACQILEVDCTAWSQDALSGFGSFTHIPVRSDGGSENMLILSEKIVSAREGGIWFAGEHTSQTEAIDGLCYTTMATATGAYRSGERAANQILQQYS